MSQAPKDPQVHVSGIAVAWSRHAAFYIPATSGVWLQLPGSPHADVQGGDGGA